MGNLPFWSRWKNHLFWYIVLIGVFLLSLDFWNWEVSKPLILGLPLWMWYFIGLTLSLSPIFYAITRTVWRNEE